MSVPQTLLAERYRLVRKIAAGGMGVVWEAWDERLQRPVAVKELRTQPGVTEEEAEQAKNRAMREARITARLHHPHAVPVFDAVEHEGRPCLVMQYLPSTPLSAVLRERGRLEPHEVARIGAEIASALAAAHKLKIVHRDVKPGNILITDEGTAHISDFGISHALGDATLTRTGMVYGTPAYLAPEVARGGDSTFASDVFSLGSTLYAALEGDPPFGSDPNSIALLHRVASGNMTPPQHAGVLTPFLLDMLSPEPKQRPSMRSIASLLAGLQHEPGSGKPTLPLPLADRSPAATKSGADPQSDHPDAAERPEPGSELPWAFSRNDPAAGGSAAVATEAVAAPHLEPEPEAGSRSSSELAAEPDPEREPDATPAPESGGRVEPEGVIEPEAGAEPEARPAPAAEAGPEPASASGTAGHAASVDESGTSAASGTAAPVGGAAVAGAGAAAGGPGGATASPPRLIQPKRPGGTSGRIAASRAVSAPARTAPAPNRPAATVATPTIAAPTVPSPTRSASAADPPTAVTTMLGVGAPPRDPKRRRGLALLMLAAAAAVLAALFVIPGVLSGQGTQGNPGPSAAPEGSEPNGQAGGESGSPNDGEAEAPADSDPAENPAPEETEPEDAAPPEDSEDEPDPEDREQATTPEGAIIGYYALLPGDTDEAWERLTANYQQGEPIDRDYFEEFWDGFDEVTVSDVARISETEVEATVTYIHDDGTQESERRYYRFVEEDGILKIDESST